MKFVQSKKATQQLSFSRKNEYQVLYEWLLLFPLFEKKLLIAAFVREGSTNYYLLFQNLKRKFVDFLVEFYRILGNCQFESCLFQNLNNIEL
jgi:hypothetical protein